MLLDPGTTIMRSGLSVIGEVQSWDQRAHASEKANSKQHWARATFPSLIRQCSLQKRSQVIPSKDAASTTSKQLFKKRKNTASSETCVLSPTHSSVCPL